MSISILFKNDEMIVLDNVKLMGLSENSLFFKVIFENRKKNYYKIDEIKAISEL